MSGILNQMGEALEIMLVGMISVFIFLALLVWLVGQMSRLAQRWHIAPTAPSPSRRPAAQAGSSGLSAAKMAAISAAVHRYREQHTNQSASSAQ